MSLLVSFHILFIQKKKDVFLTNDAFSFIYLCNIIFSINKDKFPSLQYILAYLSILMSEAVPKVFVP